MWCYLLTTKTNIFCRIHVKRTYDMGFSKKAAGILKQITVQLQKQLKLSRHYSHISRRSTLKAHEYSSITVWVIPLKDRQINVNSNKQLCNMSNAPGLGRGSDSRLHLQQAPCFFQLNGRVRMTQWRHRWVLNNQLGRLHLAAANWHVAVVTHNNI